MGTVTNQGAANVQSYNGAFNSGSIAGVANTLTSFLALTANAVTNAKYYILNGFVVCGNAYVAGASPQIYRRGVLIHDTAPATNNMLCGGGHLRDAGLGSSHAFVIGGTGLGVGAGLVGNGNLEVVNSAFATVGGAINTANGLSTINGGSVGSAASVLFKNVVTLAPPRLYAFNYTTTTAAATIFGEYNLTVRAVF